MTTTRPEIIVEGTADGVTWQPYRFRWKPCELDRWPRFTTPHLPRLDWQMWFAALAGDCRSAPWFLRFEQRLLEGEPKVLGLSRENPFPNGPPRLPAHACIFIGSPNGVPTTGGRVMTRGCIARPSTPTRSFRVAPPPPDRSTDRGFSGTSSRDAARTVADQRDSSAGDAVDTSRSGLASSDGAALIRRARM